MDRFTRVFDRHVGRVGHVFDKQPQVVLLPKRNMTLAGIGIFSLWTPFLEPIYFERWFGWPTAIFSALVPLLVADAQDAAAMTDLCQQTRVVVSTVGPYALYGNALGAAACVSVLAVLFLARLWTGGACQ